MKTEDFVLILKNLINAWEVQNNPNHPANLEIFMWRKKFIEGLESISDQTKEHISHHLLFISSETMMKKDPESHVKDIIGLHMEDDEYFESLNWKLDDLEKSKKNLQDWDKLTDSMLNIGGTIPIFFNNENREKLRRCIKYWEGKLKDEN